MRMTNKTYYAKCNAITAKLEAVASELQALNDAFDAGRPLCADDHEYWNRLHDTKRELETERADLDREYRRRNWTAYDWQQWQMVVDNID